MTSGVNGPLARETLKAKYCLFTLSGDSMQIFNTVKVLILDAVTLFTLLRT